MVSFIFTTSCQSNSSEVNEKSAEKEAEINKSEDQPKESEAQDLPGDLVQLLQGNSGSAQNIQVINISDMQQLFQVKAIYK